MHLFSRKIGNQEKQLVILHGMYGSGDNWLSIARKLSDEFTVHLPDQRNHGRSPHHFVHTYDSMAEDLYEYAVENKLDSFYVAGHSMGGKTAIFFAVKYPQMVKKICVLDISPRTYQQLNEASEHSLFHLNLMSFLSTSGVEEAGNLIEAENILQKGIESKRLVQFLLKDLMKTPEGLKWKINLEALINNIHNIGFGLNPDDFIDKKIGIPSLFLRGLKSSYLPKVDDKLIHFIFSNVRIVDIPDAGHWLHAEQPERVVEEMRKFFT